MRDFDLMLQLVSARRQAEHQDREAPSRAREVLTRPSAPAQWRTERRLSGGLRLGEDPY
jgi:hypothetical protein